MKKNKNLKLLLLLTAALAFTLSFTPVRQEGSTIISVDMDALVKQVEESLSEQYDSMIEALELRIQALEEKVEAYERQSATLAVIANLPTATATIQGATPEPSATPTRTPNPSGYDCETTLLSPYYYGEFSPGSVFSFQVQITNTGSKTWGKDVTIEYLDGLQAEVDELYAYALPVTLAEPDDSFTINILMKAPEEKKNDGKYEATYTLKAEDENFCEFSYYIYVP